MKATDRDRVLVADFSAEGSRLGKANVMRLARRTAADDAGLCGDELAVHLVTQADVLAVTRRGLGFAGRTIGEGVDASVDPKNGSPLDAEGSCATSSSDGPSASVECPSMTVDASSIAASLSRKLVSMRAESGAVNVFFAGRFLCTQSAASSSEWRSARSATSCSRSAADCSGPRLGDGQKQVNRVWDFTSIGCLGDSCLREQRLYRGNDR